ncbi:cell division protein FtsA, partial [Burkholderia thailandensis]|nr:cell division protein FtsA [Burkholderia thailandensis]
MPERHRQGQELTRHHTQENSMSKDYKDLLVALNIGKSKVVAVVAELKG